MNNQIQELEARISALESQVQALSAPKQSQYPQSAQVLLSDIFPSAIPNSYSGASTNFMMWGTFTAANGGPTIVVSDSRILSTSRCFAQYDGSLATVVGTFGCANGSASINITGQTGTQPWNFLIIF